MKSAVIYNSQTGFTERYARWIAEQIGCEAVPYRYAKSKDFSAYDVILFGSWCHAGSIQKIKWFKGVMRKHPEKKYAVFAVGASPAGNPDIDTALKRNITDEYSGICTGFYCPGGLNYGKMSPINRAMMRAFSKMMAGRKDKTEEEKVMAEMIGRDYDISDKKYIAPIIDYVNGI